jgi:hypothetical protein
MAAATPRAEAGRDAKPIANKAKGQTALAGQGLIGMRQR